MKKVILYFGGAKSAPLMVRIYKYAAQYNLKRNTPLFRAGMSRMGLFLTVMVFLCLTLPAYCQWSDEPNIKDGIQFTVRPERDTYTVGDSIVMYLEFKNVSNKEINFYFSKCPVEFLRLYVYDEKGAEIYKNVTDHESPCYINDTQLVKLKPGESYQDTDTIDTLLWGQTSLIPMYPGKYQIRYRYTMPEYWKDLELDYWNARVLSNTVVLNFE